MSTRLWIFIAILSFFLIAILSIPTFLSSRIGTRYLIKIIEKKTGGQLSLDHLSLGWFTDQEIEKLTFIEKEGGKLQFDRLTSSISFWNLLLRNGKIGTTRIENPSLTTSSDTQVKTPAKKETQKKIHQEKKPFWDRLNGHLIINNLKLTEERRGVITELQNFDFDIKKLATRNTPLTFKFNGDVSLQGKKGWGKVQGEGKLEDFLSPTGAFDLSNMTTEVHAQIKNLPSIFIDALSKLDNTLTFPPSVLLGNLFNATIDAQIKKSQGKVTINIDASSCKALLSALLSNGILYLNEPLKGVFTVTPQLNDILNKGTELVVVAIEKPITLYIQDKGFEVPLKNLSIQNMSFNYGELDLGQIIVKDVGSAQDVSALFKMDNRGNKSLWFAPSVFNMKEGIMSIDRTEILYNQTYQVCLWGKIKFPSRKVDMTLGLTAQALHAALGIQGIDDDYVLKVPVRGPFGNVKIDKKGGASKIAFLLARKTLSPKTGIFGQILGTIGNMADDQSDVPPPKPPFPWQTH